MLVLVMEVLVCMSSICSSVVHVLSVGGRGRCSEESRPTSCWCWPIFLGSRVLYSSFIVRRRARQMQRRKRTNFMLVLVSLTFFISWAPLNIFNIILDLTNAFKVGKIHS
jgi:hypothetical protein